MARALGDKYVLEELIGSGGMGLVYRAAQPCLARTVAVKLMRAEFAADAYMLRKFHTEAIVGGRIRHRNVISVFDYGTVDGAPYLVMEYVDGQLLSSILAGEDALPVRRAASLVGDLLAGLGEAHACNVVHGDVKTDNLLVERQRDGSEVAKLIDFGLARCLEDPWLRAGDEPVLSGTPEYIAPELIMGNAPTPASDVYGAGIVLYELLTGVTPFAGGSAAEILGRHLDDEVVPPSLRNPETYIPPMIDAVVLRALAKDPVARYVDASHFAAALAAATPHENETVHARGSRPAFQSEATTSQIDQVPRRMARGTNVRDELAHALAEGNVPRIVTGYLELARQLVDERRLEAAARELEEAIDVVTHGAGPDAPDAPEPLWRLLLTLAALYDGLGNRSRARQAAESGRNLADRRASFVGRERAHALIDRLSREPAKGSHA